MEVLLGALGIAIVVDALTALKERRRRVAAATA